MNLDFLEKGKVIKNYKELCRLANIEVKAGNSKKMQLKELERYCKYIKIGNKFVIDEVYEKPKDKEDGRKNNKRKSADYIEDLELILIGEMLLNDYKTHNRLVIGKSVLLRETGLVNINYSYCKRRINKLSKFLNIDKLTVSEFFNLNNRSLMNDLERALKNLKNKGLIIINSSTILCKETTNNIKYNHVVEVDKYNEEIDKITAEAETQTIYEEATPEECSIIAKSRKKVLKEMNIDKITTVFALGRVNEYYKKVNDEVRNYIPNLHHSFEAYDISYNFDDIIKELENRGFDDWSKEDKQNFTYIVNGGVISKINLNATKRHNASIKKIEKIFGDIKLYNRSRDTYIDENMTLTDNMIKSKGIDIRQKVRKTIVDAEDKDKLVEEYIDFLL